MIQFKYGYYRPSKEAKVLTYTWAATVSDEYRKTIGPKDWIRYHYAFDLIMKKVDYRTMIEIVTVGRASEKYRDRFQNPRSLLEIQPDQRKLIQHLIEDWEEEKRKIKEGR